MNHLLLVTMFIVLVFAIMFFTFHFRSHISMVKGMMITMAIGMMVGLNVGTVLGLMYPNSLFHVTVVGILVGAIAGFITGLPIGLMAVLNGFLSGAMSGMMGAMLGGMVPAINLDDTVEIMAILSSVILFILFLMFQEELKLRKGAWIYFLGKPEPIFLILSLFLFLAYQSSFTSVQAEVNDSMISNHDHVALITVEASEYTFSPKLIHVKVGQQVTLVLHNKGKQKHEFEVSNTDIEIHAEPGLIASATVSFSKPGTYRVVCDLPGHEEAGMVGEIVVSKE